MKYILIIIGGIVLVGAALFFFQETDVSPGARDGGLKVATSIYPVYSIASEIAGDNIEVVNLLSPGTSPHTFDPTPSTIKSLQDSAMLFMIGYGLDDWAATLAGNQIELVQLDEYVALRENSGTHDHDHEEDGDDHEYDDQQHDADHDHGPVDPHYWLDPHNAVGMARQVAESLASIDPNNGEMYLARAVTFERQIEEYITQWKGELSTVNDVSFMTLHDAFYYFAEFGDLRLVATFEPFPGKTPTPQYLARLQEEVREQNVYALFSEPQLAADAIDTFAQDNNLKIGVLDPLGGVSERLSYYDIIEYNVQAIVSALK